MTDKPQTDTSQGTNLIDKITLAIVITNLIAVAVVWILYDRQLITEKTRLTKLEADIKTIYKNTTKRKENTNYSLNIKEIIDDIAPVVKTQKVTVERYQGNRMALKITLKNISKSFITVSLLQMDISDSIQIDNNDTFIKNSAKKLNILTGYSDVDDNTYEELITRYPILLEENKLTEDLLSSEKEKLLDSSEYACMSLCNQIGPGQESMIHIQFTINEPKSINYYYRYSLAVRGLPKRVRFYIKALEANPTLKNQLISLSSVVNSSNGSFFINNVNNMISVQDFNKL